MFLCVSATACCCVSVRLHACVSGSVYTQEGCVSVASVWLPVCGCMSAVSVCIHEAVCMWLCVSVVYVCTQEAVCNVCLGGCVATVLCVSPCLHMGC